MSVDTNITEFESITEIASESQLLPRFLSSVIDKFVAFVVAVVFYVLA